MAFRIVEWLRTADGHRVREWIGALSISRWSQAPRLAADRDPV